jgi:hypothetical protein
MHGIGMCMRESCVHILFYDELFVELKTSSNHRE